MQLQYKGVNTLIIILLFIFCIVSVLSVLFGIKIYTNISNNIITSQLTRTITSYLYAKVKENDIENGVKLGKFGDGDALYLIKNIDNQEYETIIYKLNNSLYELFSLSGSEMIPESGFKLYNNVDTFNLLFVDSELYIEINNTRFLIHTIK